MSSGLCLRALELLVFRLEASTTNVTPQTVLLSMFFDFATSRPIPAVTNLVRDRDGSNLFGYKSLDGGLDRRRTKGVNRPLSGVSEVIRMKIAVGAEPSLGAAILVFLEICDKVVHNYGELVEQRDLECNAFGPECETRTTFRGVGGSNGNVYHPR